jgi:hypothetical protein
VDLSQSWLRARYALGAAAISIPGQLHEHFPATRTVEGRVHFAGDHTSLKPAWIEVPWKAASAPHWGLVAASRGQVPIHRGDPHMTDTLIALIAAVVFVTGVITGIIVVVSLAIRREDRSGSLWAGAQGRVARGARFLNGVSISDGSGPKLP